MKQRAHKKLSFRQRKATKKTGNDLSSPALMCAQAEKRGLALIQQTQTAFCGNSPHAGAQRRAIRGSTGQAVTFFHTTHHHAHAGHRKKLLSKTKQPETRAQKKASGEMFVTGLVRKSFSLIRGYAESARGGKAARV